MAPTAPPPATIERPTRRAEWTQIGLASSVSAMVLLIICVLAWHSWPADTASQRIDWLGKIAAALIFTVWLLSLSFFSKNNGSEKVTAPGFSFEINAPKDPANG